MKKLAVRKKDTVYVTIDAEGAYCDFCGEKKKNLFESEYDEGKDMRKCNTQICEDCVKWLSKKIKK